MEIQRTNYTPSFRALTVSSSSEVLTNALKSSKALREFGKKYDAKVGYSGFMEENDSSVFHPGLLISEVKPVNFYRKVIDFFAGRSAINGNFFYVKTNGTTDAQFLEELKSMPRNAIVDLYNSFFK